MFKLEAMLRTISEIDGTYIIAMFDCCRVRLSKQDRGGKDQNEDNDEE